MSREQYCRLCLTEDKWNSPLPIFEGNPFEKSLCEIIKTLSGIDVHKDDGLPKVLCRKCVGLITIFMDFRDTVKKKNKLLQSLRKNYEARGNVDLKPENETVIAVSSEKIAISSNLKKRRRPGPKSKSKPIAMEDETMNITEAVNGMPIHTIDINNPKSTDPADPEISILPSTSNSDKSDSTVLLDRSRISQGKLSVTSDSDKSDSTFELDKSRNLGNAVTHDSEKSDSTVDLDKSRISEGDVPVRKERNDESVTEKPLKVCMPRPKRGRPPAGIYFCGYCNRPFIRSSDRNRHILSHTNLSCKLYICRYCSMAYSDNNELKVHCTTFHSFVTAEIFKVKDLEMKSQLMACSTSAPNAAPSSSIDLDLIEGVEPLTKRKRGDKQATSKKLRPRAKKFRDGSNATVAEVHTTLEQTVEKLKIITDRSNDGSNVTIAEIHTPIESEQPANKLKTSANKLSNSADVTFAEIHTPIESEQPAKKLKTSAIKLSNSVDVTVAEIHTPIKSEQPAEKLKTLELSNSADVTFAEIYIPIKSEQPAEKLKTRKLSFSADVTFAEIQTPRESEQPAKMTSTNKLSDSSMVDEHTPMQSIETTYADTTTVNPTEDPTNNETKSLVKAVGTFDCPIILSDEDVGINTLSSSATPSDFSNVSEVDNHQESPVEISKEPQPENTQEHLAKNSHPRDNKYPQSSSSEAKALEISNTETSPRKWIVCQAPFKSASVELIKLTSQVPESGSEMKKKCNICPFKCETMKELFHHKRSHRGNIKPT